MKLSDKLDYLQTNHMGEWLKTRSKVFDSYSTTQSVFCVCGKLATGMHETHCRKLNDTVTKETVNQLQHLLPAKRSLGV